MGRQVLFSIAAAATLLAGAVPASAATNAPANYQVIGSVPQICSVQDARLIGGLAPVNISTVTGQSITISQLVDVRTLATNSTSFDVGFDAFCNYAHRIVVESQNNGLWRQDLTPAAPGFADAVPYTANVFWGGTSTTLQANASVRQISAIAVPVDNPAAGQIELRFQILPGASNALYFSPLLAGTYSDIIRVTVEPQ
jgi:hypothetical protein